MSTTDDTEHANADLGDGTVPVASESVRKRLYYGETAYDFFGKRWWGIGLSALLVLISVASFFGRGFNLGLDFVGGVSWDVPAESLTVDDARQVLTDRGLDGEGARVQELSGDSGARLKLELKEQTIDVREAVRADLAEAAGVVPDDVDVRAVSARWGDTVTNSAVRALMVFLVLIVAFITLRFDFFMAIATITAMAHDVVVSVGVYSLLGFEVTPATVIAFLTILGFSIYDGIVVFDKVKENRQKYRAHRLGEYDIDNISMNQVLMRSLNTSIAAVLPVIALLVVGDLVLGASTLREFALALLIGMITGAYSSIFIATPMLAMFKTKGAWNPQRAIPHATGEDLRALVLGNRPMSKRQSARTQRLAVAGVTHDVAPVAADATSLRRSSTPATTTTPAPSSDSLLQHPPRPRKKKRR